ncbi:MAG: DUF5591 domain-containing protein [Candidatus Thermoplasmatota archaeon]|nr:DUF5591 domain-containing protein [Candidatus Thermoplasmatota archaeon]
MKIQTLHRDGPARVGHLTIQDTPLRTPTILFLHTARYKAPAFSELLLTDGSTQTTKPSLHIGSSIFSNKQQKTQSNACIDNYLIYPKDATLELHRSALATFKKNSECCLLPAKKELLQEVASATSAQLFIVSYAAQLFSSQSSFVDYVVNARQTIGYQKLLYLPYVGDPVNIAFLTYMGVDCFDSFQAVMAAYNDTFLFPTGHWAKTMLAELSCTCPICVKHKDASTMTQNEILTHNYYALHSEIQQVRNAIMTGTLRELIETRVRASPHVSSLLRLLDRTQFPYLEQRTALTRKHPLLATTTDALTRPEVRRFQERVIQRYEKPASAKVLLLLPCSAKKPYSSSKSHMLFRERILTAGNPAVVHELIITSPLGIVPRELELTSPASSYDIAVTGHWDAEEQTMIRTLLKQYLQKNTYEAVLMHLPTSLQKFTTDLFDQPVCTCQDTPTTEESLSSLARELHHVTSRFTRTEPRTRAVDNIRALACYQFGSALADQLMKACTIRGKYPYQKIMDQDTQLGMLTPERGLLSLTLAGAERLADAQQYWVQIDVDVPLKGSIFAPGVHEADEAIRSGDEVIIRKKNQLCGVGVACMNGAEMTEATHGEAVKLRHHR